MNTHEAGHHGLDPAKAEVQLDVVETDTIRQLLPGLLEAISQGSLMGLGSTTLAVCAFPVQPAGLHHNCSSVCAQNAAHLLG